MRTKNKKGHSKESSNPKIDPTTGKYEFKENFKKRFAPLTDLDTFLDYSTRFLRKSVRVNTLKVSLDEGKKILSNEWDIEQVPWCKEGFFVNCDYDDKDRRAVGNSIYHSLGYFYVQEAASMIPPVVLAPKPGELVLDMCASPGSKTTQMGQYMKNEGLLIGNDYKLDRIKSLSLNIQRCGITNSIVTFQEGRFFNEFKFDRILVDAPCSGIGAIRKSLKTIQMWNPNMVRRLVGTQRQLIKTAFDNLKEGGTMVYSTCTLEPEENEGVVNHLLETNDNAKLEKIDLPIKHDGAITEFEGKTYSDEVKKTLRLWPQNNNTEGFYIAKIKKL